MSPIDYPSGRNSRIQTPEDLEALESIISRQNVDAGKRVLADGGSIWVFQSLKEVESCQDLYKSEKQFCRDRFAAGEAWAGISRIPPRQALPWFVPTPGYDSHGNYRGGGSGGGGWSH